MIEKMIEKDRDGLSFVNYFDLTKVELIDKNTGIPVYFELLKNKVKELEKKESLDIKPKYLWLKQKLDDLFESYKKQYYNDRKKEEFPELYEYIKSVASQK
jgi:hypothetical protein